MGGRAQRGLCRQAPGRRCPDVLWRAGPLHNKCKYCDLVSCNRPPNVAEFITRRRILFLAGPSSSQVAGWRGSGCQDSFGASASGKAKDTLAEWLRRRPAKRMGSPRVGSNPIGVELLYLVVYCGGLELMSGVAGRSLMECSGRVAQHVSAFAIALLGRVLTGTAPKPTRDAAWS